MLVDELEPGTRVEGLIPGEIITVVAAAPHGGGAVELTYKRGSGELAQQMVFASDVETLSVAQAEGRSFDADADDFKLVAEAQRIRMAGHFDPMLAVATSDVQPLPHQIRAVYGELLPRTPLRFLLADDPGAGKTIMAGLYIKELILRDDVERCLIVAPGGLVEQWQDELRFKFGLDFELLTNQMIDADVEGNPFQNHPRLIARMDQLARNEELQRHLEDSAWDLVIVDEAHRMGASYFGNELRKTRRYQLGEILGEVTRHFLLMTATPHAGKEEDFQLFLSLLDKDRFVGKAKAATDTSGVMRRMVKEDLLTFEGRKLFPERVAETVPYQLTPLEYELYEAVTHYVREGMNRADRIGGRRKNTVGFALTVLQRRLASSPEAIYQSLVRRNRRLERRKQDLINGRTEAPEDSADVSSFDDEEYSAEEFEALEEDLLDAATASQTVAELDTELLELSDLTRLARQVRDRGEDRKWSELSEILQEHALTTDSTGLPRKLIIFTEHRDTLEYLRAKIGSLLGRNDAVRAIHGGVRRHDRRAITEEFTHNSDCRVLLATDAAGEGLNLQAAHLMVNYDLPWNPNRIEQRFGRIHRIGQEQVCRLWNLVAQDTREGQVFTRLLEKVEQQSRAYGGKVFDVLGEAFEERPLRDLLKEAIRYGDDPAVKARMHEVIDESVGEGLTDLVKDRALATDDLSQGELKRLRAQMDEARARRLQPHYIEMAFRAAFEALGGRMHRREKGRFEISNVPAGIRQTSSRPIATRYERVTFDIDHVQSEGKPRAELLAPGHPLHDTVMQRVLDERHGVLDAGTVLVSGDIDEPRLLVGVVEEITDATTETVSRRFGYAYVDSTGAVHEAGPAPYLDFVAAPAMPVVDEARRQDWLVDAEGQARSWMVAHRLPDYLEETRGRRGEELVRTRALVTRRLEEESERLHMDSAVAAEKERAGEKVKESSASLERKAQDLEARLERRLDVLDRQEHMSIKPPSIVTAALVLPLAVVEDEVPSDAPMHAIETTEVERRAVDRVLDAERALGRVPEEQPFTNPGFDILSQAPDGHSYRIEVKGRLKGAEDFFVTHNEVMTGKNAAPYYRLALVAVDPDGSEHDDLRYVADPFAGVELGDFHATGHRGHWQSTWAKGQEPF